MTTIPAPLPPADGLPAPSTASPPVLTPAAGDALADDAVLAPDDAFADDDVSHWQRVSPRAANAWRGRWRLGGCLAGSWIALLLALTFCANLDRGTHVFTPLLASQASQTAQAHAGGAPAALQQTPHAAGACGAQQTPWQPNGASWEGVVVVTNLAGHTPWTGCVMLRGAQGEECDNAPYRQSVFPVALGPADVRGGAADQHTRAIACRIGARADLSAIPAHEFGGLWPSVWPATAATMLLAIDNPAPFVLRQAHG
jgi:hypothetical protein